MTGYNQFSRQRAPLTLDTLQARHPAVFATQEAGHLSDKYLFIPTATIVSRLMDSGWVCVSAAEARVTKAERDGFQRHMLRFHRVDAAPVRDVGDLVPELILTNSHDGTSAFRLHMGLFRLVCSNGMVVADQTLQSISVRHSGKAPDDIIDASFTLMADVPQLMESVRHMQSLQLQKPEQRALAEAAAVLRWSATDAETGSLITPPVSPDQLLRPRRYGDDKADLWTTMNVVQENLMQGGLRTRTSTGRRNSTRAVSSPAEDVRLNKALWTLAEALRKSRAA